MATEEKRMKYIDADKIKAKIDKITESLTKSCNPDPLGTTEECMTAADIEALGLVKSVIDQMQQEEPLPPGIENEIQKKGWLDYGLMVSEIRQKVIEDAIFLIVHYASHGHDKNQRKKVISELKSLRLVKQEWSEEDEERIMELISLLKDAEDYLKEHGNMFSYNPMLLINWLKSLRPQTRWKPSDEHVKALNYVVNLMASSESPKENDYYYNVFKDLREQLKKLKEE